MSFQIACIDRHKVTLVAFVSLFSGRSVHFDGKLFTITGFFNFSCDEFNFYFLGLCFSKIYVLLPLTYKTTRWKIGDLVSGYHKVSINQQKQKLGILQFGLFVCLNDYIIFSFFIDDIL